MKRTIWKGLAIALLAVMLGTLLPSAPLNAAAAETNAAVTNAAEAVATETDAKGSSDQSAAQQPITCTGPILPAADKDNARNVLVSAYYYEQPLAGVSETAEPNGIVDKLNALRQKYPDQKFWNHCANEYHNSYGYYLNCTSPLCMDPDGYTDTPCTVHFDAVSEGEYGCNQFDYGIQCSGFARKLFYEIFGVYASSLEQRTDVENVMVGDIIRVNNNTHSAIVLSRDGDIITIAEANFNKNCMIKWDRAIKIKTITYFRHAPNYDEVADGRTDHQIDVSLNADAFYYEDVIQVEASVPDAPETAEALASPIYAMLVDQNDQPVESFEVRQGTGLSLSAEFALTDPDMPNGVYKIVVTKTIGEDEYLGKVSFYYHKEIPQEPDWSQYHFELSVSPELLYPGQMLQLKAYAADANNEPMASAQINFFFLDEDGNDLGVIMDGIPYGYVYSYTNARGYCIISLDMSGFYEYRKLYAVAVVDDTELFDIAEFEIWHEDTPEDPVEYGITVAGIPVTSANCEDVLDDGGSVQYDPETITMLFTDAVVEGDVYVESEEETPSGGQIIFRGNGIIHGSVNAQKLSVEGEDTVIEAERLWCVYVFLLEGTLRIGSDAGGVVLWQTGGRLEGGSQRWNSLSLDAGAIVCTALAGDSISISGGTVIADTLEIGFEGSAYITGVAEVTLNGAINPNDGSRYCAFTVEGARSITLMDEAQLTLGGRVENLSVNVQGGTVYGTLETAATALYGGIVTDITISAGRVEVDTLSAGSKLSILGETERVESDSVSGQEIEIGEGLVIREPRRGKVLTDAEDGRAYVYEANGETKATHVVIEPGEPEPEAFTLTLRDYTKGAVAMALEPGELYAGELNFTVSCESACVVAVATADGYTELSCVMLEGVPVFHLDVQSDIELVIVLRGDTNLDGSVGTKDATFVRKIVAQVAGIENQLPDLALSMLAGDANADGSVGTKDATAIRKVVAQVAGFTLPWKEQPIIA